MLKRHNYRSIGEEKELQVAFVKTRAKHENGGDLIDKIDPQETKSLATDKDGDDIHLLLKKRQKKV